MKPVPGWKCLSSEKYVGDDPIPLIMSKLLYRLKDINNLVGDLFGTITLLALICGLNFHTFDPKSFCLMNPREALCGPYREGLSCANQHEFNLTTGLGFYYAEYAGMFQTHRTGKV